MISHLHAAQANLRVSQPEEHWGSSRIFKPVAINRGGVEAHSNKVLFCMATTVPTPARHGFQTDDTSLHPLPPRFLPAMRLTFDDAVTLIARRFLPSAGWQPRS